MQQLDVFYTINVGFVQCVLHNLDAVVAWCIELDAPRNFIVASNNTFDCQYGLYGAVGHILINILINILIKIEGE